MVFFSDIISDWCVCVYLGQTVLACEGYFR
uniref:Uncharacterized protein n=1 Tax=Anguilla anguilla TaxID=7936 RepID=A0A0E9XXH2_ANGAN